MRVIPADDAILMRQGVARLLEDAGFEVVAQMADASDECRTRRNSSWLTGRVTCNDRDEFDAEGRAS